MMLKTLLLFAVIATVQCSVIKEKLGMDPIRGLYPSARQGQRGDASLSRTLWQHRQPSAAQPATAQPTTQPTSAPQSSWPQSFWLQPSWPQPSAPQSPTPQPSWPQPFAPQPPAPQPSWPQFSWHQPSAPQPAWPQFSWPSPSWPQYSRPQATAPSAPDLKESVDILLKVATIEQMVKDSNDMLKKGSSGNKASPQPCNNSQPSQQGCTAPPPK